MYLSTTIIGDVAKPRPARFNCFEQSIKIFLENLQP
jgi:hypothetical protein